MTTFSAGQRVYHRQLRQFGTYVQDDWHREDAIVDFGDDDVRRITKAQLVPAEEAEVAE